MALSAFTMRVLFTTLISCCGLLLLTGCDVSKGSGVSATPAPRTQRTQFLDSAVAYIERPLPKMNNGNVKPDALFSPAVLTQALI